MGCVNESGCLGPRRREREVYADILTSIHEQAQKIQFSNNLNIYIVIRDKLTKKGYLRKLLDNLTSHRSKINECLSYNLRVATQSRKIENKYAGLIVLNEVVNNLYQVKQSNEIFTENKTFIKSSSSQTKKLITVETINNNSLMPDTRADLHFFWLILHLIENQARMYSNTLESIAVFCHNRQEKLTVRPETSRVLQLILQRLQKGVCVEESADAYLALIEQLKDNSQEEGEEYAIFLAFIRLWLSKHSQGQVYDGIEASLQTKYERIIKVLVRRSISSSKSGTIYRALFTIYDEQKFNGPKSIAMEELVFKIIQENDLHSSTIRGVFLYLLQYLSVVINKEKNSLVRSIGSDQFNVIRYPRITDKGTRLKAFQTLRRWGEKGYLQLQEYVSFSASALVRAYTVNLNNQKEHTQEIMREFLKLTEQFKSEFTLILISLLMEEIKYESSNQYLRQIIIVLVREVIEARRLLENPPVHFVYFIPIEPTFSRDTMLELIQLMGFIAKQVPSSFYSITQSTDGQFLQNLCQFLFSIYECMAASGGQPRQGKKSEDDQVLFKYQFSNSVISFLKCLTERGAYPIVLAYLSSINSSLTTTSLTIGKTYTYFLLYVIYEGMHILNSKQKIPDKMAALNFRLTPSLRSYEIKPEIQKIVDQLTGSRGELTEKLISQLNAIVLHLKDFIMLSDQEFKISLNLFSDYFKSSKKKESFYMETSLNQFRRQSMASSHNQSDREKSKIDDESFKDILQKINGI